MIVQFRAGTSEKLGCQPSIDDYRLPAILVFWMIYAFGMCMKREVLEWIHYKP
jgi:hypothetical protein